MFSWRDVEKESLFT